jgi:hypothetical protein
MSVPGQRLTLTGRPELCWFLDAGNDQTFRALS